MSKIIPAEDAVALIQSGDVVAVSGYGTNGVPEKLLAMLETRFLADDEPCELTLVFAGGIGDGKDRGLNRLGHEGLLKRVIGGHFGLIPKIEALARDNKIEAYNFPEGVITHLYRNIAAGKRGALSRIGLETFVDPRLEGAKVNEAAKEDLVELLSLNGEESLYFSAPPVDVALIRGTTADSDGNISLERESLSLENLSLAMAARNSGGIVICQVERVAQLNSIDARLVRVPGFMVDCIVLAEPEYHMQNYGEQYNPALSGEIRVPLESLPPLPLDEKKIVLRRAAMELTPRAIVNLGVGLASGVGNIANEEKISDQIMLTVDPGIYGGVPLAGYGFGAALNYIATIDHATQFDFIDGGGIDIACLGFAECDGAGNVNASRFSGRVTGCGGFINISQKSKKVVFVGTFTSGGLQTKIKNRKLSIVKEGKFRKFVESVSQVTFSGKRAGREGRAVLYVTERCVFTLREDGLELIEVAPGVDIHKDILDQLPFEPIVNNPKPMMPSLFHSDVIGMRESISDIGIEDRVHYDPGSNTLFLDFAGMRVKNLQDLDRIQVAVESTLKPLGRRVISIVNYDSFWVDPDITDKYMDLVQYVEDNFYLKVSRYTTNGFMRIKLSRGLEERRISSDVVHDYVEARKSLKEK
ncbi:acyl CoA:acetate/3-ketoacid CoA transferase [Pseudomonadota bacterium]